MEVSDTIIVLIMSALEFYYFFKSVFIVAFVSSWFLTHFIGVCVTGIGLFGRSPRLTCLIVYVILLTWGIRVTE